jgi:hypothetical protein
MRRAKCPAKFGPSKCSFYTKHPGKVQNGNGSEEVKHLSVESEKITKTFPPPMLLLLFVHLSACLTVCL